MTISTISKFEINCDFCIGSCEWVTGQSQKMANKILLEQTDWEIIGKKHKCPTCVLNAKGVQDEN